MGKSGPKNIQELTGYACLAYGLTSPNIWKFANGESVSVNSPLLSNNTEVIIQSAILAQGIAYISAMIIEQELADNKL